MYTYTPYQGERPKTAQEQRELDTINGKIAQAIMRPVRRLRNSRLMARQSLRSPEVHHCAAPSTDPRNGAGEADVLSISQSHHSLEDIYPELISQSEEAHHK